jgi:lipopolysaccharide/colanic/teichoic acid biosynthesis glycosyltransferase
MQGAISTDSLREIDALALSPVNQRRYAYYIAKRVLDLAISILALIILFPLIIIVAILIKLDSPGPVFFKQERISIKRKTFKNISYWQQYKFRCYKFRTMICDADPSLHQSYIKALINNDAESMAALQGEDSQVKKLTRDPRVTRLGKFLRKSSIDEIPQFFNVIKGDMSLVGPRPAIPYEVEMYKPWHYRRLETKPGITGLWQVTARSACDFDEIVRLDILYIDQQSFWQDLKILFRTPIAVLFCRGAV